MAQTQTRANTVGHRINGGILPIKCIQINLQHNRAAVNNILQIIEQLNVDILFVQEPHIIDNKIIGIPSKYRTFSFESGRIRAAIVVTNTTLDAILIKQISNKDAAVIEVTQGKLKFLAASIYFDINDDINNELTMIENILNHCKGKGTPIAADSNARS